MVPLDSALSVTTQPTSQEDSYVSSHESPGLLGTLAQYREFSIIGEEEPFTFSARALAGWPAGDLCQFSLTNEKPSTHALCQSVFHSTQQVAGFAQGYLRINFKIWRKENLANLAFSFLLDCSPSPLHLHLEEATQTVLQRILLQIQKGQKQIGTLSNCHSYFPPSSSDLVGNSTQAEHSVPRVSRTRSFGKVKSPVPIHLRASQILHGLLNHLIIFTVWELLTTVIVLPSILLKL